MAYDKHQATDEFARWSESYDRCILQWLLFGPSHRAIRRIRAVAGERPIRVLDVGCGTGVFASRWQRTALPAARVWGVDLVADMLAKGDRPLAAACRRGPAGARG